MGRPVIIRASYVNDAQYLTRIARAIEMDKARSPEWRRKALSLLEELTGLFMSTRAPEVDVPPLKKAAR
jgi:hypothetical protein